MVAVAVFQPLVGKPVTHVHLIMREAHVIVAYLKGVATPPVAVVTWDAGEDFGLTNAMHDAISTVLHVTSYGSRCHQKTGTCTHGCTYNRHGTYCGKECSDNCEQNDGESPCNGSGVCTNGCVSGYIGTSCNIERRINTASSTNIATAALVGVFATLVMCTAAGCYLWNRRRSKPIEQNSEIQLDQAENERAYEQLRIQA
ncbi:hypothetical protein MAR_032262, partial [Mya arenaria]